ncbi:MAG: aconitase/3-isopropylmalate dehydratase large subunit family protein [Oscillospiraceae bacterium]|nr:aconitase/3-isopropylmalate dehydratase large subunit family protein [Oscillospiraceae bacterium]
MSEKILARHAGAVSVHPGDVLTCGVDYAANHDMYFTVRGQADYERISKIKYPDRCVILLDHAVPAPTIGDAIGCVKAREFAKKHSISNFFDVGDHAVIHQLLAERGFAAPGRLIAGGDSHTCAAGAFNCAARGFGPADMTYIWCKGETWYRVSHTILYELKGKLPAMVSGKDLFLYIAGVFGDVTGFNVEFGGDGIKSLSISQRQSVAAMCAEINAEFAVFPCDELLEAWLKARGDAEINAVAPDSDAKYAEVREIILDEIVPYIAKPHFIPDNCVPVTDVEGIKVDQVVIGSCSNGRTDDLKAAADLLKGKRVADGTRLIITPASQRVYLESLKLGYIETLAEAGAVVTNAACGACYGGHMGLIGPGERCLSTTTRNFKGRMGAPDSEIMLCAPYTAAASALYGVITDPRKLQGGNA